MNSEPVPPQPQRNPGTLLHYAAYRAIDWLAARAPYALQYQVAKLGADAYFKLDARARQTLISNLSAVAPDAAPAKIRALTRAAFRSFGRYLCEFIGSRGLSPEFIDQRVTVTGRAHIDAALALGRGLIFCSAHYSNWELGCPVVARLGYPITALVQEHSIEKIDRIFVERRARAGVKVVHSQHGALRALRALRANETVALLGDRPTGGPVVEVKFFGRMTNLPQGPWRLALSTGAPILPTFVHRIGENYALDFEAPLHIPVYNKERDAARSLAQEWAKCFEARVRADPAQWAVFYPVWSLDEFER